MVASTASGTASVVRVQVAHGDRRLDVALPAAVAVVEYQSEVTRSLGVEVASRWERIGRGPLDPSAPLGAQGVRDGDLLVVLAADDPGRLTRFDDLAEAVREVTAAEFPPWRPGWTSGVLGLVAATALGLAALLLPLLGRGPSLVVATATVLVVLLATGARSLAASDAGAAEEVVAIGVAAAHALVAGLALAPTAGGGPWLGGGAALVVTGLLAAVCLHRARWVCVVPLLVGAACLAAAVGAATLRVEPGLLLTLLAAGAVLAGRLVPGALLDATVVRGDRGRDGAVDVARLRRDLRLAHALVGCGAVVQALLVLVAVPYAVGAGPTATVWVSSLVGLFVLRCRHEVLRVHVALQSASAAAVGSALVVALALEPGGVVVAVVSLSVVALVAASSRGIRLASAPRLAWALDGLERLLVVALLPGWVVVSGVVPGWSAWT